jgi:hypothetical protein
VSQWLHLRRPFSRRSLMTGARSDGQWWQWWLSLWETCTQFAKCKNHHIWISKSTINWGKSPNHHD